MSTGFVYWLLMLLWLIFGVWSNHAPFIAGHYGLVGGNLLLFVLLLLLGWKTFGAPLKG